MASETDICNRALALLGQEKIININDPNNVAEMCNTLYPSSRDKCFEDRMWSFCLKRIMAAPLTVPPPFGYANQFQVPSDCIILRSVDDGNSRGTLDWVREGDKILTDAAEIAIIYSATVLNPDLWTNAFIEALVFKLASDLAMPLTENAKIRNTYEQDYHRKIQEAGATDGGQGRQVRLRSDSLIIARMSGNQISRW